MENKIDFYQLVRTMSMIAGLRDCCWTSLLLAWIRSGLRPLRLFVLYFTVCERGLGLSLTLPRSHSGQRPPRSLLFFLSLRSQPDTASEGQTTYMEGMPCRGNFSLLVK
jgi:hypothetical protein